jgi:hypothetical protein
MSSMTVSYRKMLDGFEWKRKSVQIKMKLTPSRVNSAPPS